MARTAAQREADRLRRALSRERKRTEAVVVKPVAVPLCFIEAMIDAGHLPAWDQDDRDAIHAALETYLCTVEVIRVTA